MHDSSVELISAAKRLRDEVARLRFPAPVAHIYNPLEYAWDMHELYLRRYGAGKKKIVFVGMNPGPFGMVQTGVPFGEIKAVREWLKLEGTVNKPAKEHPKTRVWGLECERSEVSGRRLWGLFAERFGTAEKFFADHFVANYCPLAFLEEGGANYTPEKFNKATCERLFKICDAHLRDVLETLDPEWVIGVGAFAEARARAVAPQRKVGKILHPSPASPLANRDWPGMAVKQLKELGAW